MRRKWLTCFIVMAVLIIGSGSLVFADNYAVRVLNMGEFKESKVPAQIINGHIMIPINEIFGDVYGCTVEWNKADKSINITSPDTTPKTKLKFKMGSKTMYINGTAVKIEEAPTTIFGKTLVPLKSLSQGLKTGVGYDQDKRIIVLGLATDNPKEVMAVNAQDHTNIPISGVKSQETRMEGDIEIAKLYAVASSDPEYTYELKGHPYKNKFKVLFYLTDESVYFSIKDLQKPDPNQRIKWKDEFGLVYVNRIGDIFEAIPSLEAVYGEAWCYNRFGNYYLYYSGYYHDSLEDAMMTYIQDYMPVLSQEEEPEETIDGSTDDEGYDETMDETIDDTINRLSNEYKYKYGY